MPERNPRVWPFMWDGGGQLLALCARRSADYEFTADARQSTEHPESSTDSVLMSRGLSTFSPQIAAFFVFCEAVTYLSVHLLEPPELGGDDANPDAADRATGDRDPPDAHEPSAGRTGSGCTPPSSSDSTGGGSPLPVSLNA